MAGRKKDPIWCSFIEEPTISGKGVKATCRDCGLQMMGIVARMKKHKGNCSPPEEILQREENQVPTSQMVVKRKAVDDERNNGKPSKKTMNMYVTKTTAAERSVLDEQIARYIYATNSSFRCVEHKEFKKMISTLRPGYTPPNKVEIGGVLLDRIFKQEKENCRNVLNGQTVSMGLDGWSNIHNEPIICATVTTSSGEVYLIDSVDTSGNPHTNDYLVQLAKEILSKCETQYQCVVRSLVTDNTNNVKSMRNELDKQLDLITYGCSAHLLNLLASDFKVPNIKEHIVQVIKYFRNNHFANAKYKQEGGLKLILPQDVCWNSMTDCLSSYIQNWSTLMKICKEHRGNIDVVHNKVTNISLKRNAEDFLLYLKPISTALDRVQRDDCTISCAYMEGVGNEFKAIKR